VRHEARVAAPQRSVQNLLGGREVRPLRFCAGQSPAAPNAPTTTPATVKAVASAGRPTGPPEATAPADPTNPRSGGWSPMPADPTPPPRVLDAGAQLLAHPERRIARVINGLSCTKESRAWPGHPILIPRGGPRPWGSYQGSAPGLISLDRMDDLRNDVPLEIVGDRSVPMACGPTWTRHNSLAGAVALRVAHLA
jgi:hypothetical protein